MELFVFINFILVINSALILGFIYRAIRYRKDITITIVFATILSIMFLAYIMAIYTGEFPETVNRLYFPNL